MARTTMVAGAVETLSWAAFHRLTRSGGLLFLQASIARFRVIGQP
jgi:hypothetical protein